MLKTKTITTANATVLVVEVEQGATDVSVKGLNIEYCLEKYLEGETTVWHGLPQGNWQLLGRLPDITQGYVYELIPEVTTPIMGFKAYPNFDKDGYCKTALESISSLLQANEVLFENPKKHPGNYKVSREDYYKMKQEWQQAQSKVWDIERTYLFIKVD